MRIYGRQNNAQLFRTRLPVLRFRQIDAILRYEMNMFIVERFVTLQNGVAVFYSCATFYINGFFKSVSSRLFTAKRLKYCSYRI